MRFLYRYQDKERGVLEGEVAASSESDAYAVLRKSGIRPMKVWAKPGLVNRLSSIGKRGLAIVVLAVVCLALGVVTFENRSSRNRTIEQSNNRTIASPLPRQQIPAVDVPFAFSSERFLARFARPGAMPESGDAEAELADLKDALATPLRVGKGDTPDAVLLKRVVAGLKEEVRMIVDSGRDVSAVITFFVSRQQMEHDYREGLLREVRFEKDDAARKSKTDETNRRLRQMGFLEIAP